MDLLIVLRELEERFLSPEVGGETQAASALLGDDFIEFGSSGTVYDKARVLKALKAEKDEALLYERQTSDWAVRELSPSVALITYRLRRRQVPAHPWQVSLRSSIWRRSDVSWQMIFHQGTKSQAANTE